MDEKLLAEILGQLVRIGDALEVMARAGAPQEPNYIKPIGEYAGYDWNSIGATVVNSDQDGPTHLEWGGYLWTRRSPSNKFKFAIWFSRASGKDAEGNTEYLKLITFREFTDAEPIPAKMAAAPAARPGPKAAIPAPSTPAPVAKPVEPKPGEFVDTQTYYTLGNGKKWNLPRDWLANIAKFSGVDVNQKKPNFAPAYPLLPYFAEGKANGLDLEMLMAILQENKMNLQTAAVKMRANVPAKDEF